MRGRYYCVNAPALFFRLCRYVYCDIQSITAILKVFRMRETFLQFVSALTIKFTRFTLCVVGFIPLLGDFRGRRCLDILAMFRFGIRYKYDLRRVRVRA